MNVLLLNADESQVARVAGFLGPNRKVARPAEGDSTDAWPLAVVCLDAGRALEQVKEARESVGYSTVLVGVAGELPTEVAPLIDAGLDDLADSLDGFLARYPFFAARLKQRAQRHLRLEAIMENTVDGIVVIDARGRVHSVNKAVERIFGFVPSEVIGSNVSMLMPSPDREQHDGYLARYLATGEPRIIGIGREVVGKRKDGSLFPLDLAVSEALIEGESYFAGVVRDISERRRLESEILRASEEERRRIGRDLHDGLGQMLTGIGLIARNVARGLSEAGSPGADDVSEIAELVRDADEQARALAQGLVPVELDRNGLPAALDRLCRQAERLFGGQCQYTRSGIPALNDGTASVNVYRIAQEAVSNAFKHGRADKVSLETTSDAGVFRLLVMDNGVGFEEPVHHTGMGVRIMHYRASVLGGQLHIRKRKEGGTMVSCEIPIERKVTEKGS